MVHLEGYSRLWTCTAILSQAGAIHILLLIPFDTSKAAHGHPWQLCRCPRKQHMLRKKKKKKEEEKEKEQKEQKKKHMLCLCITLHLGTRSMGVELAGGH